VGDRNGNEMWNLRDVESLGHQVIQVDDDTFSRFDAIPDPNERLLAASCYHLHRPRLLLLRT